MYSSYGLNFPPNQKANRQLCEPLCDSQKLHFNLRLPLDTHEGQAGSKLRCVPVQPDGLTTCTKVGCCISVRFLLRWHTLKLTMTRKT